VYLEVVTFSFYSKCGDTVGFVIPSVHLCNWGPSNQGQLLPWE